MFDSLSFFEMDVIVSGGCGRGCVAGCNAEMDLVFVLDSAGTVHPERWHYLLDFVEWIVGQLDVAADRTRVAVVYWSESAYVGFTLDQYFVKQVRSVNSNCSPQLVQFRHVSQQIMTSSL